MAKKRKLPVETEGSKAEKEGNHYWTRIIVTVITVGGGIVVAYLKYGAGPEDLGAKADAVAKAGGNAAQATDGGPVFQAGRDIVFPPGKESPLKNPEERPNDVQPPPSVAKTAGLSLSEFFDRQDSLDGRFLELQSFLDGLSGCEVVWRGYVYDVSNGSLRIRVSDEENQMRGAYVSLGPTRETKLFSLQHGDLVEVKGIFRSGGPIYATVDGSALEVVKARRG